MRRVASVLALLVALAAPAGASAHSGQSGGTDYRSAVTSAPTGVSARIVGGDDRIRITRTRDAAVVILGYGGEPYLRIDARGTWENRASPAVALNDVRRTSEPVPEGADRRAPEWVRTGGGDSVVFHDHRSHWMGSQPPAVVRADPSRSRTLYEWRIPVAVGGTPGAIEGTLAWVAPPTTWLWWTATALVALLASAVGLLVRAPVPLGIAGMLAAVGAALSTGISQQLDLPEPTTGVALGVVIGVGLVAVGLGVGHRLRAVPAHALTVILLVALLAGGVQLLGLAGDAFAFGVVPGALPAWAMRVLVVAGLAGVALAAGACGQAWRGLIATTTPPPAERKPAAW